jgi:RNA polymerase sigma-70 factor, ECF subfamily
MPEQAHLREAPRAGCRLGKELAMNTTSYSLMERLRQPAQQEAWARFVKLYTPLIYQWARGASLSSQEAADLVQEVLTLLVEKLPSFAYDRKKSFRGWLRTVTLNKWREKRRRWRPPLEAMAQEGLADLSVPDSTAAFEEAEYTRYVVHRAQELMRAEFQEQTWKACWECVVVGRPPAEVARELGITTNAVYLAKSRVLRRLHQELSGLLD